MNNKLFRHWWKEAGQYLNDSRMTIDGTRKYFAHEGFWAGYLAGRSDTKTVKDNSTQSRGSEREGGS